MEVNISHIDSSRFSLLSGLSAPCLEQLLLPATRIHCKPQTHLLLPGALIDNVYLVERGWVKVYRLNEHGQESISAIRGAGDSVLINMLFCNHSSIIGVRAKTECELLQIPADHVRNMLTVHNEFALRLVREISDLSHNLIYLLEQVTVQSALQRVGSFLLMAMLENKREPALHFELSYGKSEIAHYIGLTAETFSRCLKLLAKQGIEVTGRGITLPTLTSLCAHCDPYTAQKCRRYSEKNFCRLSNCLEK